MFRALVQQALRWCLLLGVGRLSSAWNVTSGSCTIDSNGCVSSTNYPSSFPSSDACTIQIPEGNTRPIVVVAFDIEDSCCDKLWVNGIEYRGDDSIDNIVPQGTISWDAGFSSYSRGTRWKICLGEAPVQVPAVLVLDGHCDAEVNGRYELRAYTARKPVYEHTGGKRYLYYKPDCADDPEYRRDFEVPAWTVSRLYESYRRPPFDSYYNDRENYVGCRSRAYVENNTELPPESARWRIHCYEPTKWTETVLAISPEPITTTTSTMTSITTTRTRPANVSPYLRVQRSCRSSLSGVYELQGWSLLGRPWYKCENIITFSAVYLWYDEQCGAAWYFKSTAPDDGAASCTFYSRADSQAILPPASGWQTNCTESQTDLSPDQVSIVTATWFVSSGSCEILPESQCITTSSFPRRFYGSYEHCTIQVADNNTSPMQVLAFKTGSEDSLMVNGQSYSGTTGPDDVVPQGTIEWRADYVDAASGYGWVICLGEVPANMAKVAAGRPWRVVAGYCKVDDEGCITNGNYPKSDNAICGIFVEESNERRLFWERRAERAPLLINGEEFNGNDRTFGPVPEGFILRRAGSSHSSPDSFKICLEVWFLEQRWFWASVSSSLIGSSCCLFCFYWLRRRARQQAQRKWEEKHGHLFDKWYSHYRHAMYSIIQSAFDEGAPGVKPWIIKRPTQLDLGRAYLFKAAGKLQVDMSEAFESQKHPFYVDGKKVLDYTKINWASQISLKALGEEIKNKTADGCAVIIAACDVKDVGEVKRVVRAHNRAKELQGSHGRAKFAFMPLFDELPKREGEGVKRCGWYSFYRFSVMAKMQIAVDEGATRLKLLGIQPDVGNAMTVQEYPALEEDLLEARSNRKYPFIDVAGEKLLLEAEEFTMARERLEDFRQESFLDDHTNDLGSVIIVSATDADGRAAAKVLQAFHARHKGARQVMRAWATAADQYADPHGDHGSQGHSPLPRKANERTGKATTSTQDFTNILPTLSTEEKHPEGLTCQLESLDYGLAPRAPKPEDAKSCCWPANSEAEDDGSFTETLDPDLRDRRRGEAVYCGNLLCRPP